MIKKYDVIIIGAGPGGLTAALYASRANLSVAIVDKGLYGGQMNNTGAIDNYPGFADITGPQLSEKMYQSAMKFGAEYFYADVQQIIVEQQMKKVITEKDEFHAPAVLIATGAVHKHLNIPGEDTYQGRGVSYCAVCDAAFFRNEEIAVIGGGDSAIEEGLYLAQTAKKVTIIHRRNELRAQPVLQKMAFANDKIDFVWNANTEEILGDGSRVTAVKYYDKNAEEQKILNVSGVFIYVGVQANSMAFSNLGICDEHGWIITDDHMQTKVEGIFALGDVRQKDLRQIATAVGEGSIAGQAAYHYLQTLKN